MDCKTARLLLDFARPGPGDIDPAEAAALEQHLEHCPDCAPLAQVERRFDAAVGPAMLRVEIPDGLKRRLMKRIIVQGDAWYRRVLVRTAVAAGLLIAVASAGVWWFSHRAVLDLNHTLIVAGPVRQAPRPEIDKWLHQVGGGPLEAPTQFNYLLFESADLVVLEERQLVPLFQQRQIVPMLQFTRNSAQQGGIAEYARVYILSDSQFNLKKARAMEFDESNAFGRNARILEHPSNSRILYVVSYTGSLEHFFAPAEGKKSHP